MTTTPRKKAAEPKSGTALTLSPGRFGPVGYAAGVIIEGLPPTVAESPPDWLEVDAAKVREARRAGAAVVQYRA